MQGNLQINVEHKTFIEDNRKGKIHQQTTKLQTSIQNLCRLAEFTDDSWGQIWFEDFAPGKRIDMSQLGQEWLLNKDLQNFQTQFHGPAPVPQTKSTD